MFPKVFGFLTLTSALCITLTSCTWTYEGTTVTLALVNYTYLDPRRDGVVVEVGQVGKFAPGQVMSASGRVVVGEMARNSSDTGGNSCVLTWFPPTDAHARPWVALMARGKCPDEEKIELAGLNNASAVILYTSKQHAHLRKLNIDYPGGVVWMGEEEGKGLAGVVLGGGEVVITITPGHNLRYHVTTVNRTSVVFVSVSFIILMAISLAWLIFYYIQRFRYIHAKDRLARHLCNAAKKALTKIPVKTLKPTDREVITEGECCAVCIEPYQTTEILRILPCKHQFHRWCVDPWLLENRTCPMCKMDILKHYGYVLSESEESVLDLDLGDGDPERLHSGFDPSPQTPHVTPIVVVTRERGGRGGGGGDSPPSPSSPLSSQSKYIERQEEEEEEEEEEEDSHIVEEERREVRTPDRTSHTPSPSSQIVSVTHF